MKKFLSTVAMLAMMLALCSSTCSGSSDDEDDYGVGTSQGVKTLYVDDVGSNRWHQNKRLLHPSGFPSCYGSPAIEER